MQAELGLERVGAAFERVVILFVVVALQPEEEGAVALIRRRVQLLEMKKSCKSGRETEIEFVSRALERDRDRMR